MDSEGLPAQEDVTKGEGGDYKDLLYAVMTCNRDVKLSMEATKKLFPPIREQYATLKKHGVVMDDDRMKELDTAPSKWDEIIRTSYDVKEQILPLQQMEVGSIRKEIDAFSLSVQGWKKEVQVIRYIIHLFRHVIGWVDADLCK